MLFYRARTSEHPEASLDSLIHDADCYESITVPNKKVGQAPWLSGAAGDEAIIAKIDANNSKLGDIFTLGQGMQTGLNNVFGTLPPSIVKEWKIPKELWRWRARNSDIQRWTITQGDEVLLYLEDTKAFSTLPATIKSYLTKHRTELEKRAAFIRGNCEWWKYTWPLHKEFYHKRKILCPYLASFNRFALDETGRFIGLTDTTVIFDGDQPEDICYFLGLLNSRVLTWRFTFIGKLKSGGIREYFWNSISKFPIARQNLSIASQKKRHDQIVERVRKIIELNQERNDASVQETAAIDRTILKLEEQVEDAVADIFGLTSKEREYIERALRREPATAGH